MSFSLRCERTGLEYNGTSLNTLFAQRRNLLRPSFLRMLTDILRFNRESPALLHPPEDGMTLADYLERNGYSRSFIAAVHRADGARYLVGERVGDAGVPGELLHRASLPATGF